MNRNNQAHIEHQSTKGGEAFVYDPEFKGPKKERSSTDVAFTIIFSIVVVLWLAMGFWAIGTSDFIKKLSDNRLVITNGSFGSKDMSLALLAANFKMVMLPVFVGLLLSMIAAIVLMFSLRWLSAVIAWAFIAVFHGLLLTVAIMGFVRYSSASKYGRPDANTGLFAGICGTIAFIVFLIVVILMRKRIKFAIALIKESSRAVSSMWSTVFFPIIPAIFQLAVIEFFVVVLYCLIGLKESEANYSDGLLNFLHVFNVIACIWDLLFISALSQISLAGAFGTWYWTYDKANVPYFIMTLSATRSAIYHSGTAAFGALLVTICRILSQITNASTHNGQCGVCGLCLRCLFSWMEDFLKRFNRNAYIMCAIHGRGLCASAISAYQLILRNILRCVATDLITGIIFGFCKVFLAAATGWFGWLYFDAHYTGVPLFAIWILVVGAYLIASAFFSVYAIAVDTLVLCALEDVERNDGSIQRPYYMSRRLMKILAKDQASEAYWTVQQGGAPNFNNSY